MVSAAKPKVAEYPFTTLHPELGMVERAPGNRFVMADIPGLIEGAARGTGLGISFLRHLRRTRLLLHLVDIGPDGIADPVVATHTIEHELGEFDQELYERPRWLVLNKIDLLDEGEAQRITTELIRALAWKGPAYLISGATGQGCKSLTNDVFSWLDQEGREGLQL